MASSMSRLSLRVSTLPMTMGLCLGAAAWWGTVELVDHWMAMFGSNGFSIFTRSLVFTTGLLPVPPGADGEPMLLYTCLMGLFLS